MKPLSTISINRHLSRLFTACFAFLIFAAGVKGQEKNLALPDDPLQGRIIFEKKGCIICHSIFGYGGDDAPDIGESKFYGSLLDLGSIMWNHSPQMSRQMRRRQVARPNFSEKEMYSLLAYLYFLPYLGDIGEPQKGKILLHKKGCLGCHSTNENPNNKAKNLNSLSQYASPLYMAQSMWNHSPTMGQEMQQSTIKRPTLSGKDMSNISAYIRDSNTRAASEKVYMSPGNPNRGKKIFFEKKCSSCHATERGEISEATNLAEANLHKSVLEISAALWNHGLQMHELMASEKIDFPIFEGGEMADVIAYLYFLTFSEQPGSVASGEKIFAKKGCASCPALADAK